MSSNRQAQQVIGNILTYIALGLIVAAQPNRYWSTVRSTTTSIEVQYGLYQRCAVAGSLETCSDYDWEPETTEEYAAMVSRIILIITDLFIGIAFITSFVAFCLSESSRSTCLKVTGGLNIGGGVVIIIVAIEYIALSLTSFFSNTVTNSLLNQNWNAGFCYGFAWASGILFIIGGVLQVVSAAPERAVVQPSQQTIIMATHQNPMALPATTYPQNYGGGYYNPSAAVPNPDLYPQEKLRASYPTY